MVSVRSTATKARETGRPDARAKASGQLRYVADLEFPGLLHAAIARSTVSHGAIVAVDGDAARHCPGVFGVYSGTDIKPATYGRAVFDVPLLAQGKVRYIGEAVAVAVANTREQAEFAAAQIEITYHELEAILDPARATDDDAPLVHDAPWAYPRAYIKESDGRNLQAVGSIGSREAAEDALADATFIVDATYRTAAVHQGYLETWGCVAAIEESGLVRVWATNKSPHILRSQLEASLDISSENLEIQPTFIGGDFGGKGSPGHVPLAIELARITGRPVSVVLRYADELISTNPRHPSVTRVRVGCDEHGKLLGAFTTSRLDGGAYAGFNPNSGPVGGTFDPSGYRIPAFYSESQIVYTNTLPKGNMRAPGSPQAIFAFESALDELAHRSKIDPYQFRRINLLHNGEPNAFNKIWREVRGVETIDATHARSTAPRGPKGWLVGSGWSIYAKPTKTEATVSMRLSKRPDGGLLVEVPVPETGTGSHTVIRKLMAERLGYAVDDVQVVQGQTGTFPRGLHAGGSRVTATISTSANYVGEAWAAHDSDEPLTVDINKPPDEIGVGSYAVQLAQVAVDPESGQVAVLKIINGIDVGGIVNPLAHQMQIDGGTAMGYGFACLEDLDEHEGQVWAANLGEFKIPSMRDVPRFETALVHGGIGVGMANIKNVGELTTPPTAAAIANAVFAATGCRMRELPITAERVFQALHGRERSK